jgi:hypothetical protein
MRLDSPLHLQIELEFSFETFDIHLSSIDFFQAFSSVNEKLTPLLDGVQANRKTWQSLADSYNQRLEDQKEDDIPEQKRKLEHQHSQPQQPSPQVNGQISPVEA